MSRYFPKFIPSPSVNGFGVGPLYIHFYALMYMVGLVVAVLLIRRRWARAGGDVDLVLDVATWAFPVGIVGARIYSIVTTPEVMPRAWWGPFAVWDGGLGVWGGVAAGAVAGLWRVKRVGADAGLYANAAAPALLLAQGIGRIGNYFNQELFGGPTGVPWGLEISPAHRPPGYGGYATFQPSFLYELLADLGIALLLMWLGGRLRIKPWGLFALYVAGYSAYRIFEETIRIDDAHYFFGLRLNLFVASALCMSGLLWFAWIQLAKRTTP